MERRLWCGKQHSSGEDRIFERQGHALLVYAVRVLRRVDRIAGRHRQALQEIRRFRRWRVTLPVSFKEGLHAVRGRVPACRAAHNYVNLNIGRKLALEMAAAEFVQWTIVGI